MVDYGCRTAVQAALVDVTELSNWLPLGVPAECHNVFMIAFMENYDDKKNVFFFFYKKPKTFLLLSVCYFTIIGDLQITKEHSR